MLKKNNIAILMLAALAAAGCKEDDIDISDEFNRPLNAAAPIVLAQSSALSLAERWLSGTEWFAGEDGTLTTTYISRETASADDILKLQDMVLNINESLLPTGEPMSFVRPTSYWDNVEGQRLDEVVVKSGTIHLVAPASEATGTVTMTLMDRNGDIKDESGNVLQTTWELSEGTTQDIDLTGYIISPIGTEEEPVHWYLNTRFDLTNMSPTMGASFEARYTTDAIRARKAHGFFGNHIVLSDLSNVGLTVFDDDNRTDGVDFCGMSADVTLNSTVGTPLLWDMSSIRFSDSDSAVHTLEYKNGSMAQSMGQQSYDDFLKSGILKPQSSSIHIDDSNSNISECFSRHPSKMSYDVDLIANPYGEVAGETNFVTEESGFEAEVKLTVPLWVRIRELIRHDEVELNLDDLFDDENIDYVDSVKISIITDNGLPMKLYVQGYFRAGDEVVGQLFDEMKVACGTAPLDANDKVTGTTHNVLNGLLTYEQVKRYYDQGVDNLMIETKVTTEDTGDRFVKIHKDYTIKGKVTAEVVSSAKKK